MSVERHEIQEQNVGAYLLGALDPVEARAFEDHLDECPVCRDEVERLRVAVDALPRSVQQLDAPSSLKASIMSEALQGADTPKRGRIFSGRLSWPQLPRPALAWAAAGVVLLAGVGAGLLAAGGFDGDESGQTVAAQVDPGRLGGASGSLAMPANGHEGAILRVQGMPELPEAGVYQVWVKRGDEVVSQSLFTVGRDGEGAAAIPDDLGGADAVLVTREPAGGARSPSEKPVLSVTL